MGRGRTFQVEIDGAVLESQNVEEEQWRKGKIEPLKTFSALESDLQALSVILLFVL